MNIEQAAVSCRQQYYSWLWITAVICARETSERFVVASTRPHVQNQLAPSVHSYMCVTYGTQCSLASSLAFKYGTSRQETGKRILHDNHQIHTHRLTNYGIHSNELVSFDSHHRDDSLRKAWALTKLFKARPVNQRRSTYLQNVVWESN
jgi:hypothetical protein